MPPIVTVREEWHPEAILLGGHVEGTGDTLFRRVTVAFDHLAEWAKAPFIRPQIDYDNATRMVERVRASAERVTLQEANLEGATIRLIDFPKYSPSNRAVNLELVTAFQIDLHTPLPWRTILEDWTSPLCDLVALGTAVPTRTLFLRCTPYSNLGEDEQSVELRYQTSTTLSLSECHSFEMPMLASEFPGGFEAGIRQWLRIWVTHAHAVRALGGLLHAPFIYLEDRFVALVRAAEAFHTVEFASAGGASSEHTARIVRVLELTASLDADDRTWLESMLENSQAPVARHRILDLLNDLGVVGTLVSGGDPDRFAKAIIQTRNCLTHPQSRPGSNALRDTEERFWHSEALLWLMRGLLLKSLGFISDEVGERLRRSPRFQHAMDRIGQLSQAR